MESGGGELGNEEIGKCPDMGQSPNSLISQLPSPASHATHTSHTSHTGRAVATATLIALQVAVWLVVVFRFRNDQWLDYALVPRDFNLQRLLVSPFLHVHPFHLGINLAVLWLFGSGLERAIGTPRFVALYLGAGWFAGLMHWAVTTAAQLDLHLPAAHAAGAIGSSGAVAGVLGAYVVRLPHRPLRVPFTGWRVPPAPLLGGWLVWEFSEALSSTMRGTGAGIGHWAHFGGFVFGLVAAHLMRLTPVARLEQLRETAATAVSRDDLETAAAAWAAILAERPDAEDVRCSLVRAHLALGDRPGAEELVSQGLAVDLKAGRVAAALDAYRGALELLPDLRLPRGLRFRIGCCLADAGADREALAALLTAAHEDAATPAAAASALFRAGEIAADRLQDAQLARACWQRVLLEYADSPWRDAAYGRLSGLRGAVGATD